MWIEVLLFFALLLLYVYRWVTGSWDEFKKRGVPYAEPSFPWGSKNAKQAMMGEVSFFEADKLLGRGDFKDTKIWGYYMMGQPTLVINDEDLAKHILIKDFDHFTDLRSFGYHSESKDGMLIKYMYTNMKGEKWKKVRSMMSGVFTAGKLKHMTPFIVQCADNMVPYLDDLAANDTEFEVRDIASRFTLDAFASAGFGIENDSFKDPDNVFRKMALELVGAPGFGSSWDMPRAVFIMIFPTFSKMMGIPNFPKIPLEFLCGIIEKTYQERMKTGFRRNDIIDVCVEEMKKSVHHEEFKDDMEPILIANALMLFFAGFDTQAITIALMMHNMVRNEDIQDRLIEEVDEALEASEGKITYDLVENLKYMDMVFKEAFRYKMLFTSHERVCTKDYKIPDTDIVVPKGRIVHVFIEGIINSKENFIDPDNFNPENFNPENFKNKFANMAFGQGPRSCPGTRYAYLAVKIFCVKFFSQYRVEAGEKTNQGELELDPNVSFGIKGGTWMKLKKRF